MTTRYKTACIARTMEIATQDYRAVYNLAPDWGGGGPQSRDTYQPLRRRHARVKKVAPYGGNGIHEGKALFYWLFGGVEARARSGGVPGWFSYLYSHTICGLIPPCDPPLASFYRSSFCGPSRSQSGCRLLLELIPSFFYRTEG